MWNPWTKAVLKEMLLGTAVAAEDLLSNVHLLLLIFRNHRHDVLHTMKRV